MAGDDRVKAKDVAIVANVSLSAVSRTFTPGASVSPETRARILAVADDLGYRPNILARGLITRRTQLVAVVMLRADSPFFWQFLSKLNHSLSLEGQRMLLMLIDARDEADEALEQALDYSVDGMIFVSSAPSRTAARKAARAPAPIVVLDRADAAPGTSLVWTDGPSIAAKVAAVFIAEGRRQAVAISGFKGEPQPKELLAFCALMEAATGRPTPLIETGTTYEDGVAAAHALLKGPRPPDAVFTATDYLAIGFQDAARLQLSVDVPEALSIIGLGDTAQSEWMSHAITTIHPPVDILVRTAVATLIERIEDPKKRASHASIDCEVVFRQSTRARPGPAPA